MSSASQALGIIQGKSSALPDSLNVGGLLTLGHLIPEYCTHSHSQLSRLKMAPISHAFQCVQCEQQPLPPQAVIAHFLLSQAL